MQQKTKMPHRPSVLAAMMVLLMLFTGGCGLFGPQQSQTPRPAVSEGAVQRELHSPEATTAGEQTTPASVSESGAVETPVAAEEETATPSEEPTAGPEQTPPPAKRDQDACLILIRNGAGSANTEYAVNGLHVYDPDSKDLDDFVSGAEVQKGSRVSIYVYPLASDVRLTVTHQGKTVVDKVYPKIQALVDDDKVEFIDLTLEGDLASRYSHRLLAMRQGQVYRYGTPGEVFTADMLEHCFRIDGEIVPDPKTGKPLCVSYDLYEKG